jgi:hypothetical protein
VRRRARAPFQIALACASVVTGVPVVEQRVRRLFLRGLLGDDWLARPPTRLQRWLARPLLTQDLVAAARDLGRKLELNLLERMGRG